jgi:saposin
MAAWLALTILSFFLLSISSSVDGTGTHHCTWGPSYWCESIENALECSAVEYCIGNVWNKTSGRSIGALGNIEKIKPSPGLCLLCNFTLELVKPYIDSNATENEISHILEKICSLLGPYNYTCQGEIVEFIFPAVWVVLQLEVDYGVACSNLHFCNSTNLTTTSTVSTEEAEILVSTYRKQTEVGAGPVTEGPPVKGPLCSICKKIISELKPHIDKNTTEPDLQKTLDSICKYLPSPYNNTCDQSVKEYLPLFYDIVKKQLDVGAACQDLGFCTNSTTGENPFSPAVSHSSVTPGGVEKESPVLCEVCELVADFLKIYLQTNSSEEKLEAAVERLCNDLPSNKTCLVFVDEYFPLMWKLVQENTDTKDICKQVKVCSNVDSFDVHLQEPLDKCTACTDAAKVLKPLMASNATGNAVLQAMDILCNYIAPDYPGSCRGTWDTYLPIVWQLIHKEIEDQQLCVKLTFCNSSSSSEIQPHKPTFDPLLCKACELVVEDFKPVINSKSTLPKIKKVAKSFCPDIPTPYSWDCNTFVEEYIPLLYEIFLKQAFVSCAALHG